MIRQPTAGFTAIELLISLFVASILVIGFYQLFAVIDRGNFIARNNVTANNLALSNLNRFPWKPNDMPACASTPSGGHQPAGFPDSTTPNMNNLTGSVEQTVRLFYPRPCGQKDDVVKVVSSVTYGPASERITVRQATYVNAKD